MGSVKQQPSGMWRARYRDPDGREHARHFRLRKDAQQWVSVNQTALGRGDWIDPRKVATFQEFAEVWRAGQHWRPATAKAQLSALRAHLYPRFGAQPLHAIRTSEVQTFVRALAHERGAGTVRNVVKVGRAVYSAAVADGLVARSPFAAVKAPRYDPVVTIPSGAEVAALTAAAPAQWRIAVALGAMAGLRTGEALGLSVDRVDFLRRQLRVDRQLVDPAGGGVRFAPPKSARGDRTVPIAERLVDELAAHVAEFGTSSPWLPVVDEFGLPFTRPRWSVTWSAVRAGAGVDTRFHDLRHRFASTLLSADPPVPIPAVAAALGDTETVLLRTYAHVLEGDDDRVRAALHQAFGRAGDGFADSVRTLDA